MLHRLLGIHHRAARSDNRSLDIQTEYSLFFSLFKIFITLGIYNILKTGALQILDKQIRIKKIFKQQFRGHNAAGRFSAAGHSD